MAQPMRCSFIRLGSVLTGLAGLAGLTGCLKETAPPSVTVVPHAPVAAGAGQQPAAGKAEAAAPAHWWTQGGSPARSYLAAGAGPLSWPAKPLWKLELPQGGVSEVLEDSQGRMFTTSEGRLARIDPAGKLAWLSGEGTDYSGLTLTPDDQLVAVRGGGNGRSSAAGAAELQVLTADGMVLAGWQAPQGLLAPAVTPQGIAVFSARDPYQGQTGPVALYAVGMDGTLHWEAQFTDLTGGSFGHPPAVDREGAIYFGSATGKCYCFGPDGTSRWISLERRKYLGRHVPKTEFGDTGVINLLPSGNAVFNTGNDGPLLAHDASGKVQWKFTPQRDFSLGLAQSPQGELYVSDHLGRLTKIDAAGHIIWDQQLTDFGAARLVVDKNGTLFAGEMQRLMAVDPQGRLLWDAPTSGFTSALSMKADGTLLLVSMDMSGPMTIYALK